MILIGLTGKKGSGKSTVASHLQSNHSFKELSFAYPLKEYIGKQILGLSDEQLSSPKLKEVVDPRWDRSPRQLLQLIGTELMRDQIHKDIWVRATEKIIDDSKDSRFVISDVRFLNEVEMIKRRGGIVVRVVRPALNSADAHPSECELDNYPVDFTLMGVENDLSVLRSAATELILDIRKGIRNAV